MANGGGLDRVGQKLQQAGVSFLTGIPQIDLDRKAADTALVSAQAGEAQAATEQAKVTAQADLDFQRLSRTAFGDGPGADEALQELFVRDPTQAEELFTGLGVVDQSHREDVSRRAAEIQATAPEDRRAVIMEQAAEIEARGGDPDQTMSLLEMSPEDQDQRLRIVQAAALSTKERATQAGGGGKPSEQRTFEALIEQMSPEDQKKARRIEAGLDPRASISADERIALNAELAALVASSQADIREAGKFAELTGSSRAKAIDSGFETIQKIDANIRNLDKAVEALDAGAETGSLIARFSPTVREQSVILGQIQASLGLDVVQSVSFGALSEGELNLALATALPTSLDEPALRQWIVDRQAAQGKLRDYFSDQIQFLDQGGTVAGFLRQQERQADAAGGSGEVTQADLDNMTPEERALFEK